MRYKILLATVSAVCVAVSASGLEAQTTKKCRAADSLSANLINQLTVIATSTDSETVADRNNIYHVPALSANQITLVTDEKVCTKLVSAVALLPAKRTPVNLYVVKLGSKGYAAWDPTEMAGEYRIVFIFDTKYAKVGGWTGG
jgi:hypothetical protein